jgi:hypothetical protein
MTKAERWAFNVLVVEPMLHRIRMIRLLLAGGRIVYTKGNQVPSVSKKQHNLMEMAAHNAAFAKAKGIPQKVAKEFVAADKAAGKYKGKKK